MQTVGDINGDTYTSTLHCVHIYLVKEIYLYLYISTLYLVLIGSVLATMRPRRNTKQQLNY
jgi:hypothetical protein